MTDEEKAEEYVDKMLSDSKYPFIFNKEKVKAYIIKVYLDSLKCCEEAYNKGLTEGRKENEDLKKQIEQMKCCALCKFLSFDNVDLFCNAKDEYVVANAVCEKWEQDK